MYERFTDRSRKVMQLANEEAQRFSHDYIGTEHILLGIAKTEESTAAKVLANLRVIPHQLAREVEKIVQRGPIDEREVTGHLPHTPRAKKVIEYSIEEARNLNHDYVGTEHLLLGLLREGDGVAAEVLSRLGVEHEAARRAVLDLLGQS